MNPLIEPPDARPYRMQAGSEPLPGYTLTQPLGQGGFGEVWQCEAPGGLQKAIKFVFAEQDDNGPEGNCLRQEFEAFQHIKSIRHPFLLTLERVELTAHALIMVMELADEHLMDRFNSCRMAGHFGIPREDLLGYLADAAEALDYMNVRHGLQHLDVKPANLFLVAEHVKVGDYGLVARLQGSEDGTRTGRGLTPRYCAPEVARGEINPHSDQYSLALVYQELLTGTFAFQSKSVAHMLFQHATAEPNLSGLPAGDRAAVRQALAKKPADRYASCSEFIHTLMAAGGGVARAGIRRSGVVAPPAISPTRSTTLSPSSARLVTPAQSRQSTPVPAPPVMTDPPTLPGVGEVVTLTPAPAPLQTRRRAGSNPAVALTSEYVLGSPVTQLTEIQLVLPVARLLGDTTSDRYAPTVAEWTHAIILQVADSPTHVPRPSDLSPQRDGSWITSFPIKPMVGMTRLKLDIFRELWNAEIIEPEPGRFSLVCRCESGGWLSKKRGSLDLHIRLPDTVHPMGEAEIIGRVSGQVEPHLIARLPAMLEEVRSQLQNCEERRQTKRLRCDLPVMVYPIHRDGVLPGVPAICEEVSVGGFRLTAEYPLDTAYAYLQFESAPTVANWAALTRFLRHKLLGERFQVAGRFRTEL
ncbi:MAG: protein kinase [Bacteroidales bacterium]|nr:protein kinase [Bacteroidales bacterium]